MAGKTKHGKFQEKLTPFILDKLTEIREREGEWTSNYRGLYLQYAALPEERKNEKEDNTRHWEADICAETGDNVILRGLERLYDNTIVIEPTMTCAAHCRHCLRAHYETFSLNEKELIDIAKYCGQNYHGVPPREVLVTGGDPLLIPERLVVLVEGLLQYAPNIHTIRIGTRLPQQAPNLVSEKIYNIFRNYRNQIRFEVATQINHPVELFPEVRVVFQKLMHLGVRLYSQNVILKKVNDNVQTLVNLYNTIRDMNIESHYLFHCVPMRGTHHMRTSVKTAIRLYKELTNSGKISGRIKPMGALMTDIGKLTLYEDIIVDRDCSTNHILVQSAYQYKERLALNPNWRLPKTAEVDEQGYLRVWYLDGADDSKELFL